MRSIVLTWILSTCVFLPSLGDDSSPRATRAPRGQANQAVELPVSGAAENGRKLLEHWTRMRRPESDRNVADQALGVPDFPSTEGLTDAAPNEWEPIGVGIHNPNATLANSNHFSGRATGVQYARNPESGEYELFLATGGGGVWRLDLLGVVPLWIPVSDNLPGEPSVGAFHVDPLDSRRMIIGSGDWERYQGDGIYRTLDGGSNWQRVLDVPRNCFEIVADETDPNRVLAATDTGLYFSEQFGEAGSWYSVWANRVTDVIQDPADPQRWLAGGLDGILESTDGGRNFYSINVDGGTGISTPRDRINLAISPQSPNHVFALVTGHSQCGDPESIADGGNGLLDIECDDNATCASFNVCTSGSGAVTTVPCSIDPDCESIGGECIVSTCRDVFPSGRMNGIYRSDDGGQVWKHLDTTDRIRGADQAYHTAALEVDPQNANRLFVGLAEWQWTENALATGGGDLVQPVKWHRRSNVDCDLNGDGTIDIANTATCDLQSSHADYTSFYFTPSEVDPDETRVIITNDGGVYFFEPSTGVFDGASNEFGLLTSQTMSPGALSVSRLAPNDALAGLQDNGMIDVDLAAPINLTFVRGGDGGISHISPRDQDTVFFSSGVSYSRFFSKDFMQTQESVQCSLGNQWTPPIMTHPGSSAPDDDLMFTQDPQNIYFQPVGPSCDWMAAADMPYDSPLNPRIFDMSTNPDHHVFYTTFWNSQKLLVLDDRLGGDLGTLAWTDRTPPLARPTVDRHGLVAVDRDDSRPGTVYYMTGKSRPSAAYISNDYGETWRDVSGTLAWAIPDANWLELIANPADQRQMFMATDIGIFRTDTGDLETPRWHRYMDGLPAVAWIQDVELDIHAAENPVLTIGTYGRGFWRREVAPVTGGSIGVGDNVDLPPLLVTLDESTGEVALSWSRSCALQDDDFVVYEGNLLQPGSHAPRLCSTGGQHEATLLTNPNAYFLVAPSGIQDDNRIQGSLGYDSEGVQRIAPSTCFPQQTSACP